MSDLDDLAAAARGGSSRKPSAPVPRKAAAPTRRVQPSLEQMEPEPVEEETAYSPPQPVPAGGGGLDAKTWVWLSVGMVVVLALAFWLINRDTGAPAGTEAVATAGPGKPAAAKPPTTTVVSPPAESDTAAPAPAPAPALGVAASPQAAAKMPDAPATRPGWGALEDVEDPADAIVVYHLKRISTDTIEFKIRNKSKRGVYVRALEFFAESNDRVPLGESITFWLPPGGLVPGEREIAEMAKRLGDEEGVTAVVQDAEFSDMMPDEIRQLMNEAEGGGDDEGAERSDATEDAGSSQKKPGNAGELLMASRARPPLPGSF